MAVSNQEEQRKRTEEERKRRQKREEEMQRVEEERQLKRIQEEEQLREATLAAKALHEQQQKAKQVRLPSSIVAPSTISHTYGTNYTYG